MEIEQQPEMSKQKPLKFKELHDQVYEEYHDRKTEYDVAEAIVCEMRDFLSSRFEDIEKSGINPAMEEIRNSLRALKNDNAIAQAETYYQKHYKPSHPEASEALVDLIIKERKKSEQDSPEASDKDEALEKFQKDQEVYFVEGEDIAGEGKKILKSGTVGQVMRDTIVVNIEGGTTGANVLRERLYDKATIDQLLNDKETFSVLAESLKAKE